MGTRKPTKEWNEYIKFTDNCLNSNSCNKLMRAFSFTSFFAKEVSSNSTGQSNMIVASCLDKMACSAKFSTFSLSFPFRSAVFSINVSIVSLPKPSISNPALEPKNIIPSFLARLHFVFPLHLGTFSSS